MKLGRVVLLDERPNRLSITHLLGMMRELLDLRESLFATVNIDPRTT